jgi:murein DD-endopeptidase MepM/ murein hydrolase activator NlpD
MRIRNERLTVILVPQGGARTYSFQARVGVIVAAGVALVVLQLVTITLMFTYGRYFHASRQTGRLQRRVETLERELRQVDDLRQELARTESTRKQVLGLMAAGRATPDSLGFAASAGAVPEVGAEDLRASEEYFARSVPRSWPTRGFVTQEFLAANRDAQRFHPGIDIAAPAGTPVRAAAGGAVTFAGWDPQYGYLVGIDHGMGIETFYGHNSRLTVTAGQRVERGTLIGWVGSTGRSSGPHLHFEVRKDGIPVDPRQYLD